MTVCDARALHSGAAQGRRKGSLGAERCSSGIKLPHAAELLAVRNPAYGAAMESNHPSVGLPRPAGFEGRMGHQTRAAPVKS
jgi:hypothetical protein